MATDMQNRRIRLLRELGGDIFWGLFFADGGCVKEQTIGTEFSAGVIISTFAGELLPIDDCCVSCATSKHKP